MFEVWICSFVGMFVVDIFVVGMLALCVYSLCVCSRQCVRCVRERDHMLVHVGRIYRLTKQCGLWYNRCVSWEQRGEQF